MSDKTLENIEIPKVTSLDILEALFGCSWTSLPTLHPKAFPNKVIKIKLVKSNAYDDAHCIVYFDLKRGSSYENIDCTYDIRGITRMTDKFEIIPQYSIKGLYET